MTTTKKIICLILLVSLVLLSLAWTQRVKGSSQYDHTLASIDAYVQTQMSRSSIPGLSYAIIQEQRVVQINAFGEAGPDGRPMTSQTPLYIGSVGKTFTALAVRQLVNSGLIGLDDPVITYLPEFRLANAEAAKQITIRQLLEHTSGLSNKDGNDPVFYDPEKTSAELLGILRGCSVNRPVGTSYEYSNLNYIVLGRVIEKVSGLPYDEYLSANIFDPLEMKHSFTSESQALTDGLSAGYRHFFGMPVAVDLDEPTGAAAAGFSMSSAEDLAQFLIAYTNGGAIGGRSVVHLDGSPRPGEASYTYNVYWLNQLEASRAGNTEVHSGGWLNYSAGIVFMPEDKIGVVVLANAYPAQWLPVKDASAIAFDVLRLYTGNQPNPETQTLLGSYLLVDAVLLLAVGFLLWRGLGLGQQQFGRIETVSAGKWVGVLLLDLALPIAVLVFLPALVLGETESIDLIRCWNRLLFQVPDISSAVIIIAATGIGIGILKARKYNLLDWELKRSRVE